MTPYYQDEFITLYNGDCRDVLPQLERESVQGVVTSPPYFGLRSYLPDTVRLSPDAPQFVIDELAALGILPLDLTTE